MICIVDGCERPSRSRTKPGLCGMHEQRKRTYGDVGPPGSFRPRIPVEQKILERHRVTSDGCWEWTGARSPLGYGVVNAQTRFVHRAAYEAFVGPIPDGLELDHLCRNRACVNPAHLEPVTHQENMRRGKLGALREVATHCAKGHPFDEANTYWRQGSRHCKACSAARNRRYRARKRQQGAA